MFKVSNETLTVAELERMTKMIENKPPVVLAMNDFIFYVSSSSDYNGKCIHELTDIEFDIAVGLFIKELREELHNFRKFSIERNK